MLGDCKEPFFFTRASAEYVQWARGISWQLKLKITRSRLPGLRLLTLAIFVALDAQLSCAFAGGQRMGVLTINYTVSASDTYGVSGQSETYSDQLQESFGGESEFEVLKTGTNLWVGKLLSSTFNASISGNGSQRMLGSLDSWSYSADPAQTNGCFWTTPAQIYTNDLAGNFEVSLSTNAFLFIGYINVLNAYTGLATLTNAGFGGSESGLMMAITRLWVPFTLTNALGAWSQSFQTNSLYHCQWSGNLPGSENGGDSLTATLDYAPDQLTVPYTATPVSGTAPFTVAFACDTHDSAGNILTASLWSFGDGGAATNRSSIAYCYTNAGDFTLSLVGTNDDGQAVLGTGPTAIHVTQPSFIADLTNGPVPLTVHFSCPATQNGSSPVTKWEWDFGDGQTSMEQNPVHTYTNPADYEVSLALYNAESDFAEATGPTKIFVELPKVQFTTTPAIGAEPLLVSFKCSNLDNSGQAVIAWDWDFGDGGTNTAQNPSHTYESPGTYYPSLSGINGLGQDVEGSGPAVIVASRSGLVINGDFETGTFFAWSNSPTCTIETSARSVRSDNYGAALTSDYVDFRPALLSQVLLTAPGDSYLLSFWLHSPNNSAPGSFTVSWGGTQVWTLPAAAVPEWTNVQLIVAANTTNTLLQFSSSGMSAFGLDDVDVESAFVQFTANPAGGSAPLSVQFACPAFDNTGHAIVAWDWDFGDGASSASQNPIHLYLTGGTFAVSLVTTNDQGDTLSGFGPMITVSVPTLQFTASPTNGGPPLSVQFSCPSQDSQGNIVMGRFWDFGDGSTSTAQAPVHLYTDPGQYAPSLLATNSKSVCIAATGPAIIVAGFDGLVLNGGFETGDFTGWTVSGDPRQTRVVPDSSHTMYAHSGDWGALVGATDLTQALGTTPGGAFRLSLWLSHPITAPGDEFIAQWNGTTLMDWSNAPAFRWTNLQFSITASSSNSLLHLQFSTADAFGLDDVSLLPAVMPRPALAQAVFSSKNLVLGGLNGVAGVSYCLRSSTNLMIPPSRWIPLLTNTLQLNGPFQIVLPNAPTAANSGRFYILETH